MAWGLRGSPSSENSREWPRVKKAAASRHPGFSSQSVLQWRLVAGVHRQLGGSAAPIWVGGGLQECVPPDMRQECHSMLARLWSRQKGVCQPCGVLHHKL